MLSGALSSTRPSSTILATIDNCSWSSTLPLAMVDLSWGAHTHGLVQRAATHLKGEGGCDLETSVRDRFAALLDLVATWNRRVDLTAARSPEELVDLYLADALLLASSASGGQWVDVGCGGGAPGLVLSLLRPGLPITLVEPRAKRVAFLRSAVSQLGLSHVTVMRARSDVLTAQSFSTAVSRATLPAPSWLAEGTRLATDAVWVLLARGDIPSRDGWEIDLEVCYHWPLTGAARRAVRYVPRSG